MLNTSALQPPLDKGLEIVRTATTSTSPVLGDVGEGVAPLCRETGMRLLWSSLRICLACGITFCTGLAGVMPFAEHAQVVRVVVVAVFYMVTLCAYVLAGCSVSHKFLTAVVVSFGDVCLELVPVVWEL